MTAGRSGSAVRGDATSWGSTRWGRNRHDGDLEWENGRATMSRCFVRDMEGLWSELLKFAAVVEESLDRCLQALRDGRVDQAQRGEAAEAAGRPVGGPDRAGMRPGAGAPSAGRLRPAAGGRRAQDQRRPPPALRPGPAHRQAGQEAGRRPAGHAHPPGARGPRPRGPRPGPREPRRPHPVERRARAVGHRRRSADRPRLSGRPEAAQAGDRPLARSGPIPCCGWSTPRGTSSGSPTTPSRSPSRSSTWSRATSSGTGRPAARPGPRPRRRADARPRRSSTAWIRPARRAGPSAGG